MNLKQATAGIVVQQDSEHTHLLYGNGTACRFTNVEYARLAEIRSREPALRATHYELPRIPRRFSEFSDHQKWLYAQVIGDAEAEELFGFGPWLQRVRTAKRPNRKH